MFSLDLHVHTVLGSSDSSLIPEALHQEARRLGLDGACLSEHERIWSEQELRAHNRDQLLLLPSTEWSTDAGHIIVLGLQHRPAGMYSIEALRRHVLSKGGLMIAAHPFRYVLQPWDFRVGGLPAKRLNLDIDAAATLPLFGFVDAVEVLNGNCTDAENQMAQVVAERLGLPGIGGSDAHHTGSLGSCVTILEEKPDCVEALIAAIRGGRCRAVAGFRASKSGRGNVLTSIPAGSTMTARGSSPIAGSNLPTAGDPCPSLSNCPSRR